MSERAAKPTETSGLSGPAPIAGRRAAALAFLSGFLYFLAFPGIDLWPLAFVALAPLMVALRGQTPRRAAGLGWLSGFTMTMFGFYWLMNMLKTFSGFHWSLCLVFMSLLCAYQAGRIAFMGWLYGRATHRGWPAGPVFAAAFIASELTFPLLFPWYYGATVHQVPALIQVAELGSPLLVALVLMTANFAVAELVFARLDARPVRRQLVIGLLAVPALSALYGAIRMSQVDAKVAGSEKAKFGLVQANMSLKGKRLNRSEGLRRHLSLSKKLIAEEGPLDLMVWPESAVTGAQYEAKAYKYYERAVAKPIGVPAVFGGVLVRPVKGPRKHILFNTALASDSHGKIQGRYDKVFLLAFGEYLPFGDSFPELYKYSPHSGRFSSGKSRKPLTVDGHEIATFICYEDIVPGFVNGIMAAGEDPQLLVNLTNDAWFGDTTEPWIHLALAKFRAVEQRRYLVRATNSGVSAIVDPVGRVVKHTQTFEQDAIAVSGAWLNGSTPYRLYGDFFYWLGSALLLVACFVRRPGTPEPVVSPPEKAEGKKRKAKRRRKAKSKGTTEASDEKSSESSEV